MRVEGQLRMILDNPLPSVDPLGRIAADPSAASASFCPIRRRFDDPPPSGTNLPGQ